MLADGPLMVHGLFFWVFLVRPLGLKVGRKVTLWHIAINLNDLRRLAAFDAARVNRDFVTFWLKSCVKNKEHPDC